LRRSVTLVQRHRDHRELHSFPTRRSSDLAETGADGVEAAAWDSVTVTAVDATASSVTVGTDADPALSGCAARVDGAAQPLRAGSDRKSTRLNSSHVKSSYAVFCLKKKN